jgi:hypothetical protein
MKDKKNNNPDFLEQIINEIFDLFFKGASIICKFVWDKSKDTLSSQFNSKKPLEINTETFNTPTVWNDWRKPLYSHTLRQETDFRYIDFKINTLVMGTTGQGKNVLLDTIINERLSAKMPVMYIAPKGDKDDIVKFELLNKLHNISAIVVSDFVPDSAAYNPIANGTVSAIVERIHKSFEWSEQYYSDCSYTALIEAVSIIKGDLEAFPECRKKELEAVKYSGGSTPTFKKIEEILKSLYEKGSYEEKNISGLLNKINKINTSSFGRVLNHDDAWTISEIRKQKRSVIYSISNLKFPEISRMIGRIITLDLQHYVAEVYELASSERKKLVSMAVVVDELGAVATESFSSAFNQFRGARMNMIAGFQCLADLDKVSTLFKRVIISNSNNFFIGLMKDPDEAEFLAKMIGTKGAKKMTHKMENEEELEIGSSRDGHEFVVSPDLFKNGNTGKFVVYTFLGRHSVRDIISVKMKFTIDNLKKMTKKESQTFKVEPLLISSDFHTRRNTNPVSRINNEGSFPQQS